MNKMTPKQKATAEALQILLAEDRLRCERSFSYFYKSAFKILEPSTPYIDNWHVDYLCYILQREFERIVQGKDAPYSDILINVSPRTSKSLIFSVAFPAWAWARVPSFPLITTSYAMLLALNFSMLSQQLMDSEWYRARWPEADTFSYGKHQGGKESLEYTVNNRQGKRKVASTGSNLTGFGGLMIIQDDPQSPLQATSKAETEGAQAFYKGTLSSRLNNQNLGVIFTIMQRLAEEDMTSFILKNAEKNDQKVLHINLPAVADGSEKMPGIDRLVKGKGLTPYPGGVFFPGLLSEGVLKRIRARLGPLDFSTQYMQSPFPAEGLIAKREHFSRMSTADFDRIFRDYNKDWNFYGDTSFGDSKRVETDPTGALATWVHAGKLYIRKFGKEIVPSEDLPEWLEKFASDNGGTGNSHFKLEKRASGPTVLGMLKKRKTVVKFSPYQFPSGKGINGQSSKPEKLRACVPFLAAGNVVLIDGAWCDNFIEQVIGFPQLKHDEEVDVLVMAILDVIHNKTRKKSRMRLHN